MFALDPARATVSDFFTPAEIARAAAYSGPRYALALASLGVGLAVLAVMGLGGGSRALARWSERATRGRWALRAAVLATIVTVVPALATLPFDVASHNHARAFGLATDGTASFLRDLGVASAYAAVTSIVAALLFVWVARRFPRAWPAIVGAGGGALTVGLVFVLPIVYEPAFNTFRPVDAATRGRVLVLADRAGIRISDVLVADASRRTTAENAYVSGLGATKRVVLYDTLRRDAPPNQVDLVVAHEFGHVLNHDVRNGTLLGAAGVMLGAAVLWLVLRSGRAGAWSGARGPDDPAVIPFVALFIALAGLVTLPAQSAISRSVEARADRTAIALTGDAAGAVGLEVRLARENIADLQPNGFVRWIFFSHPPTMERIRAALEAERG